MSHRLERIASVVQAVVGDAILSRIQDPRVSRLTSVTRVSVSPDLSFTDVYVSVMGDAEQGRTTLRGLQSARGMVQSLLAHQLNTRVCPSIRFHLDESIKKGIETLRQLDALASESSDKNTPKDPEGKEGPYGEQA